MLAALPFVPAVVGKPAGRLAGKAVKFRFASGLLVKVKRPVAEAFQALGKTAAGKTLLKNFDNLPPHVQADILKKASQAKTKKHLNSILKDGILGAGGAARKISQGKWGAVIDYAAGKQQAIDHIKAGHFFNARPGLRSSRFTEGNSTITRVKSLVQEAISKGKHGANKRGDYIVTYTFNDVIGKDVTNRKTKVIRIFLDNQGNITNAYPISLRK